VRSRPRTMFGPAFSTVVMGSISARRAKSRKKHFAQKQTAREASRAGWGTYSGSSPQVKARDAKNPPFRRVLAAKPTNASPCEREPSRRETNGVPGGCSPYSIAGRGTMAEEVLATGIARHGATRLPSVEVDSFNVELKDDDGGFLGDRACKGAFRKILD